MSPSLENSTNSWSNRSHPIAEDMGFQRIIWRVERCGWIMLTILVVLALLGVFSNGLLSSTTLTNQTGAVEVEYERFLRKDASITMRLTVIQEAGVQTTIFISRSFLQAHTIEAVTPEPVRQRSVSDGVEMTFDTSGKGYRQLYFTLRPVGIGLMRSSIGIAQEPGLSLSQFIFP